ncbi:MAG TPA: hypothetical protein VE844_21030, partial [Gammaproteobacteria bacterium]|nr:hypothetical protein [Gammaproteobacteria bacterium]
MSQRYPDINSPQFGQQTRSTLVELVLAHLPLGIDGRKIDDRLAWDILCYASVKRSSIESACLELADAPSGNTTREHLDAALDPSRAGMRELEAQLNQILRAQLPKPVLRWISRRRVENAADLVEIPYHGQAAQDDDEVRRGAASDGTTHFHMYPTLAIVHSGQRFTLAMTFVWAGETLEVVLARLIKLARKLGVRFKAALLRQRLLLGRGAAVVEAATRALHHTDSGARWRRRDQRLVLWAAQLLEALYLQSRHASGIHHHRGD